MEPFVVNLSVVALFIIQMYQGNIILIKYWISKSHLIFHTDFYRHLTLYDNIGTKKVIFTSCYFKCTHQFVKHYVKYVFYLLCMFIVCRAIPEMCEALGTIF